MLLSKYHEAISICLHIFTNEKLIIYLALRAFLSPVFYIWLSKVSAKERRRYICNVFSHWLRPCSVIDRNRTRFYGVAAYVIDTVWQIIPSGNNGLSLTFLHSNAVIPHLQYNSRNMLLFRRDLFCLVNTTVPNRFIRLNYPYSFGLFHGYGCNVTITTRHVQ